MRAARVTKYGSIAVARRGEAHAGRRGGARPRPRDVGERRRLVRVQGTALRRARADGLAEAQVERARRRLRRRRRGGRRRRRRTSSPATRCTAATAGRSRNTSSPARPSSASPRTSRSRRPPPCRSRASPHCRACGITAACNPGSSSSSTVRRAASARSRSRSPRRSARRCTRSAARATSSRRASSAPIASSTTPVKTSRAAAPATTSCSTTRATGPGVRCDACSHRTATVVLVGGPRQQRLLGPLGHIVRIKLAAKLGRRTASFFIAKPNRADLAALRDLLESGQVRPVVEQRYELAQIAEAMRGMGKGTRAERRSSRSDGACPGQVRANALSPSTINGEDSRWIGNCACLASALSC